MGWYNNVPRPWRRINERLFELRPEYCYPGLRVCIALVGAPTDPRTGVGEHWNYFFIHVPTQSVYRARDADGQLKLMHRKRAKEKAQRDQHDIRLLYQLGFQVGRPYLATSDLIYCLLASRPPYYRWEAQEDGSFILFWLGDAAEWYVERAVIIRTLREYFSVKVRGKTKNRKIYLSRLEPQREIVS
jgi:hypothetical protein